MIGGTFIVDLSPLNNLKKNLVNKILKKATTVGGRVVRDAVKQNAQSIQKFGFLAKSIGIKVKIYGSNAVALVGPRSKWVREKGIRTRGEHKGQAIRFRPSYTAKLVEQGTRRSAARPWLKPALSSTAENYLQVAAEAVKQGIEQQLKKQ